MSENTTGITNYALTSMAYYKRQRDKLVECLRAMVEREPVSYGIHEEDVNCAYCGGEILTEGRSKHAADCPWMLAKFALTEGVSSVRGAQR